MPAPLLLLIGPLVAAVVLWFLPQRLQSGLGALGSFLIALLVGNLSVRPPADISLLNQQLLLTETGRTVLLYVYLGSALLFLLSILWPQGKQFVPVGLATLSPLALTLMVSSFSLAVIALLLTAAFLSILIQGGRPGSTLASFRFLAVVTLALPVFLTAGWMLESNALVFTSSIWRLLLIGIVLLLGGVPFHIWVRPVVAEAPPLVVPYLFGLIQMVFVFFIFTLLQQHPAIYENTQFLPVLRWIGALTIIVAALLSLTVWHSTRVVGYLLLVNIGATIIAITFAEAGAATAVSLVLSRFTGLLLAAVGLMLIGQQLPNVDLRDGLGLAHQRPWATALFVYGLATLVGLPLTPGFAPFWATLSLAASQSFLLALPLLLPAIAGVVTFLRVLPLFFEANPEMPGQPSETTVFVRGASTVLLAGCLLLALFPQLLLAFSSTLTAAYLQLP